MARGTGPKPVTDLSSVPANPPAMVHVPDKSRVQDEVILAETLSVTRSDPDYYPLQVGLNVLSGAFYASQALHETFESIPVWSTRSRLFLMQARSKNSPHSELFTAATPQNVQKASAMVGRDLKEMQDNQ